MEHRLHAALHSDGNRASLEEQSDKAIPGFAMDQPYPALLAELGAIPEYEDRFARVFPDGITQANIAKAIAAFERSLLTFNSPFDRYRAGDKHALSSEQKQGMDLFFSARTGCSSCHVAPLFTDNAWHNLGVPQVGPKAVDNGRADVTKNPADTGAFKTPMLRNIEQTGPYMHDGVFTTLEQVVAFYVGGGGSAPTKSPLVRPLDLTAQEQQALVAFMRSLTDPSARVDLPRLPRPRALARFGGERHRPPGTGVDAQPKDVGPPVVPDRVELRPGGAGPGDVEVGVEDALLPLQRPGQDVAVGAHDHRVTPRHPVIVATPEFVVPGTSAGTSLPRRQ